MSNRIKISDDELEAILAEVENDLTQVLKSESENLAKAVGDENDPDAGAPPPAGDAPAPGGEASPEASAPPDAAPSAPPEDSASPAAPPAEEGSAPADPAAEQGPMDVEGLKAEYSQLPPEELKMHYLAAKAAMFEVMQGAGGAAPGAPAPAPGAGAPPPPDPAAPPAMKSEVPAAQEVSASPGNGGMAKSEALAKSEAKFEELAAQVDLLTKALDLSLATPQRRAVTSLSFLKKTESGEEEVQLSKSEIMEKIGEKAKDPSLSKSDRSLINGFCVGSVDVKKIEHLLR